MAKNLYGYIKLPRSLSDEPWWRIDVMSRQACYADLVFRANTEPGDLRLETGEIIHLERGQCGYSQEALAERWGFGDRHKVKTVLTYLQNERKIRLTTDKRKTIITIVDYDCYFVPSDDAEPMVAPTEESTRQPNPPPSNAPLSREAGKIGSGSPEGGSAKSPLNAPSVDQAIAYFASVGSDYTNPEIKAAWGAFQMSAVDGQWFTQGRVARVVTDWRLAMEDEMGKRRIIYGQKNFAPGNPPPATPEKRVRTLEDIQREAREAAEGRGPDDEDNGAGYQPLSG